MGQRRRSTLATWQCVWRSVGLGRWIKRRLSKARRQAAKAELRGDRPRGVRGIESEANWKAW